MKHVDQIEYKITLHRTAREIRHFISHQSIVNSTIMLHSFNGHLDGVARFNLISFDHFHHERILARWNRNRQLRVVQLVVVDRVFAPREGTRPRRGQVGQLTQPVHNATVTFQHLAVALFTGNHRFLVVVEVDCVHDLEKLRKQN